MNDSMDLILYENFRKRIINNEDLTEKEWELFFYLEEKTKGIRIKNNEWGKVFLNTSYSSETQLKPQQKKVLEELKEEYILNNVDEIIDYSIEKKLKKNSEPKFNQNKERLSAKFFQNRQLVFAISTGVVILISTLFLFTNRNQIYTGDLVQTNQSDDKFQSKKSGESILEDGNVNSNANQQQSPETLEERDMAGSMVDLNRFSVNNYLEENISTDFRGIDSYISLTQPVVAAEYNIEKTREIIFKGELFSKLPGLNSVLIKVFDNAEKSFIEDISIIKKEVSIVKSSDKRNLIDFSIKNNFASGLYYFTFENAEGDLLYTGKFIIR